MPAASAASAFWGRGPEEKKLDEARKSASKVADLDLRAYLFSQIAEESLRQAEDQTHYLRVYANFLRKKLGKLLLVRNEPGIGYRLIEPM